MSLYIVEGDFAMLGGAGEEVSESLRSGRNRLDFDDLVGDAMPGAKPVPNSSVFFSSSERPTVRSPMLQKICQRPRSLQKPNYGRLMRLAPPSFSSWKSCSTHHPTTDTARYRAWLSSGNT